MFCLFPSHVLQLFLLSFYTLKLCHFHQYHSLPHTAVFTVFWTSSKSVLFSSIQEIWDAALPSGYELWMYPLLCCLNPVTEWACSGLLCFPCGVRVCSPAKSPAEHRPFTRSPEGLVHSLLHQAPPAALTSFLIPYDHSFCPPQLLWDASGMCLTTSLPPLQQHVWAPVPREAQPGFLLSLQTSVPWFCHLWVIPVASCSFGILLSFTGPGLYRLLTGTIAIFFSSQRYGAGFCTHFHQIHIWCNGWALRLSWPGSCDLSGMWSHITGMQRVSWWSLKGIVGKGKFSALGKNHWCLICRWNSSCFWILPMRCFVPGLHLELGG